MFDFGKIWKWMDHNRFFVIGMIAASAIWIGAQGCTPTAASPLDQAKLVNAPQLELEFKAWRAEQEIILARFDLARDDIQRQKEGWAEIQQALVTLASGGVADLPGFIQLALGLGGVGAITDNIRKRGLIAGLKRNS